MQVVELYLLQKELTNSMRQLANGRTRNCGAITGIQGFRNPISVARLVMDSSEHVFFSSHEGQISISNGFLEFDNGSLSGGEFTIDMSSIICTDLEGEYKGKLEGHLMAPDFFDVANHATATLTITEVAVGRSQNTYHITADMTIKDITKSVEFNAVVGEESATASIKVDRTAHGIKYGSGSFFDGLGDNMIYNEFDLEVSLKF